MLVLQAILSKFNTMADGGGRLQFDTPELKPDEFSEIGSVNKKHGVLVFKADVDKMSDEELEAIKQVEIKTGGLGDKKKKSKSQQLRALLYKNWENDSEGFKTAEDHYNYHLDYMIKHYKDKLDE